MLKMFQSGLPVDLHNNPTHFTCCTALLLAQTGRPSPLLQNVDQHPFDEHPPWQKPPYHHHGKTTKTTRKARQRVNGGSCYFFRGASRRSSSGHGQPNLQPVRRYVDPDDPHRQCSTSARNNDFPWEDLARSLPTGLPVTSNAPARSASWRGNIASGEHHNDGEDFASHT
jgi:hypothetical protein